MRVVVDLPAVRASRLAARLVAEDLTEQVRDLRGPLRGARVESCPDGVRLFVRLDVRGLASLADLVREMADGFPFWSFRLLAEPPECCLEVTAPGRAGELARAVFQELAR